MSKTALVTCPDYPRLSADERDLPQALEACGLEADLVSWSDAKVDWQQYSVLLLRTVWNYHLHPEAFQKWLEQVSSIPLLNSQRLVRWNFHKKYLLELAAAGISIVPSFLVEKGTKLDLTHLQRRWPNSAWVLKPAVSASAFETLKTPELSQETIQKFSRRFDLLIQPYLSEIESKGEVSLIYISGRFSHGVLKKPAHGDFRVQSEFGGQTKTYLPGTEELDLAEKTMKFLPETPLYARVDLVSQDSLWFLGELELIEPALFFAFSPGSLDRFAQAVAAQVRVLSESH